jgi:hypothetical protein
LSLTPSLDYKFQYFFARRLLNRQKQFVVASKFVSLKYDNQAVIVMFPLEAVCPETPE